MGDRLKGKVALITGAGSGIGRATALLFAREGARVGVGDLNPDGIAETVRLVVEQGGAALALPLNVTVAQEVDVAVKATVEHFGALHVLFNNAGTGERHTSLIKLEEDEWERVFAVNAKGVFLGLKYGAAAMLKAGVSGSIINTASAAGIVGNPGYAAYSSSKAACIQLTRTAALELARSNIRVNAIAPAFTATPMLDTMTSTYRDPVLAQQKLSSIIPLGRLGTTDDIANAALFLASDEASFMTGAVLVLDGGLTVQ
ncbi:SDR family NAD(P)-dependent oxidoreductase [Dictyobacter kobayashii]|uniref:Beta-ketoacyl-ACP reductase n=1 Tax=Dictyobacter kobayashii TaxID=2014872 RepID=A0A402AZD6_9CHLR|nr:SDR family NAD(P)-dependent oxidoreductase [Dictyobacter kobayashii]GCE24494.1 beta-ketoacyl-ACP reductase [Dictyobacter kobayashii]